MNNDLRSVVALVGGIVAATLVTAARLEAQSDPPSPDKLSALVDSVVGAGMAEEFLPGAVVAIVEGGHTVLLRAYGLAEVATGRRMDAESTLVRIGSITKVFTAVALAKAASRRGVSLDEPVTAWLEGLGIEGRDYGEPVRFWHLLTHTAGLDQIGRDRQDENPTQRTDLRTFLDGQLILVRRPGELSTYDTYGITLAGYLIGQLSGRPYADYLRDEIFRPLGMQRAAVEAEGPARDHLALGYGYQHGQYIPQPYEYYKTTPASSIDATAADMARFMVAFLGDGSNAHGRFLTTEEAQRFKQPQFSNLPGFPAHATGFWEDSLAGRRVLWHGGNMRGFTSLLALVPEDGRGLFVSVNRNEEGGGPIPRLTETLKEALFTHWYGEASRPAAAVPARPRAIDAERFAGYYAATLYCHTCPEGGGWAMNRVWHLEAADEPGVLMLGQSRLLAVDTNVFVSERTGRRIGFRTDAQGHPRYLVIGADTFARLDDTLLERVFGPTWRERPVTTLEARMRRARGEWGSAARAYAELAEKDPENGRVLFYAGQSAVEAGDGERAERFLRRAWAIGQWPGYTAYHLAEAVAIQGRREETLDWLERAASHGFPDLEMVQSNPRFGSVREEPRLLRLLESKGG